MLSVKHKATYMSPIVVYLRSGMVELLAPSRLSPFSSKSVLVSTPRYFRAGNPIRSPLAASSSSASKNLTLIRASSPAVRRRTVRGGAHAFKAEHFLPELSFFSPTCRDALSIT